MSCPPAPWAPPPKAQGAHVPRLGIWGVGAGTSLCVFSAVRRGDRHYRPLAVAPSSQHVLGPGLLILHRGPGPRGPAVTEVGDRVGGGPWACR